MYLLGITVEDKTDVIAVDIVDAATIDITKRWYIGILT